MSKSPNINRLDAYLSFQRRLVPASTISSPCYQKSCLNAEIVAERVKKASDKDELQKHTQCLGEVCTHVCLCIFRYLFISEGKERRRPGGRRSKSMKGQGMTRNRRTRTFWRDFGFQPKQDPGHSQLCVCFPLMVLIMTQDIDLQGDMVKF